MTERQRPLVIGVVAARPNFMKMAAVWSSLAKYPGMDAILVHTGQHYDDAMSRVFLEELGLPEPEINLNVGSGSHARQTAAVLEAFDGVLGERTPQMVIVVGDVNSTLACALAAAKRTIPLAHVEAGLRSGDRTMPEEINRLVTDTLSQELFAPSDDGVENLLREGVEPSRIHMVGNTMVDSLDRHLTAAKQRRVPERLGLERRSYGVVTLHRPANVDDLDSLREFIGALEALARILPIVFPVHPRTREAMGRSGIEARGALRLCEPLGYLDFIGLVEASRIVLTDSGGLQEETTALGVPCLTLRDNTERPITVTRGTNRLIGTDPRRIVPSAQEVLAAPIAATPQRPPLWDGRAGERIAARIAQAVGCAPTPRTEAPEGPGDMV